MHPASRVGASGSKHPDETGVRFSMPEFLAVAAGCIPTQAGIKYTNADLMAYQQCLHAGGGGRFDIPWGVDESLLAALALGASDEVGSSDNFAAPLYRRLLMAFSTGDLATARAGSVRGTVTVTVRPCGSWWP